MKAERRNKHITIIRLAVLAVPAAVLLLYEYFSMGRVGNLTADGRLYLSVADNFITTGHFIQYVRWFPGFVVPPGLPLILLLLRLLRFTEPMIIGFQAILFGGSCLLLSECERKIFGRYGLSLLFYLLAYMRCRLLLGNIMVEHYYLFLLCVILWLIFCAETQRKLLWLNLTGLFLLLTRPALSPVYLAILGYTLIVDVRKKKGIQAVAALLLPILILGLNLAVNYRETGEMILLESYSGTDLYITACADAPVTIEEGENYLDETKDAIYYDENMTMAEKSSRLGNMAKAYVREHPGVYLWKSVRRFGVLFLKCYGYLTLLPAAGAIWMIMREESREKRFLQIGLFAMNILLAMLTSFGIPEIRYTAVIWPLTALHFAALLHRLLEIRAK